MPRVFRSAAFKRRGRTGDKSSTPPRRRLPGSMPSRAWHSAHAMVSLRPPPDQVLGVAEFSLSLSASALRLPFGSLFHRVDRESSNHGANETGRVEGHIAGAQPRAATSGWPVPPGGALATALLPGIPDGSN